MLICLHIICEWQSWMVETEIIWCTKPKIFTVWPTAENNCQVLIYRPTIPKSLYSNCPPCFIFPHRCLRGISDLTWPRPDPLTPHLNPPHLVLTISKQHRHQLNVQKHSLERELWGSVWYMVCLGNEKKWGWTSIQHPYLEESPVPCKGVWTLFWR